MKLNQSVFCFAPTLFTNLKRWETKDSIGLFAQNFYALIPWNYPDDFAVNFKEDDRSTFSSFKRIPKIPYMRTLIEEQ